MWKGNLSYLEEECTHEQNEGHVLVVGDLMFKVIAPGNFLVQWNVVCILNPTDIVRVLRKVR